MIHPMKKLFEFNKENEKKYRVPYDYKFKDLGYNKLEGTSVDLTRFKNVNYKSKIEIALREFKRKVKDSGKIVEYKDRQEFQKPSAIKRRLKQCAIIREQRKLQEFDEKNTEIL